MAEKQENYGEKTVEELQNLSLSLAREIFSFNNELSLNRKLEKPHLLRKAKRDRARVLTALTKKKLVV